MNCHFVKKKIKCKCNLFTQAKEHLGVLKNSFRTCPCIPGSNWNLEMLVFEEKGKAENPEENLSEHSREPTKTQPTYDAGSGNRT